MKKLFAVWTFFGLIASSVLAMELNFSAFVPELSTLSAALILVVAVIYVYGRKRKY